MVLSVAGGPGRAAAGARPDLPPIFVGIETPVPETSVPVRRSAQEG